MEKTTFTQEDLQKEMARMMRRAITSGNEELIERASEALRRAASRNPCEVEQVGGNPTEHGGLPGLAELADLNWEIGQLR